jgi:glycosyltransferase involved in cell wall biosynthesis
MTEYPRPTVLVLASTYPRWRDDPEPGFVHELCRRLAGRFRVIALVPDAPGADASGELDGVDVVRYRYAPRRLETLVNHGGIATNLRRSRWKWLLVPGFLMGQYVAARRLVRRNRVDVIRAHWLLPQGLIAHRLNRVAGIPYLVTSHGGDLFGLRGRALNTLKRRVAASSSAMTVVSSAMCEEAVRVGLHPPRMTVLPMGVDMRERFIPDPTIQRGSDELLFVGRLVPKKGLVHLLDAMPAVLAQRPATFLTIAGFGPEEDALKAQASRLGIAARVRFLGAIAQSALPALYRSASLFVAPFIRDDSGNQEGLPVVLMEAIGCGCPVLVGDVAGIEDLLGGTRADVCVRPGDSHALATSIVASLGNPEQARMRAAAIRKAAAERIDWQNIADGYARQLQQCVDGAGTTARRAAYPSGRE